MCLFGQLLDITGSKFAMLSLKKGQKSARPVETFRSWEDYL